jgi:hypothetical protein
VVFLSSVVKVWPPASDCSTVPVVTVGIGTVGGITLRGGGVRALLAA